MSSNRTTVKTNVNNKIVPVMITETHREVLNADFADNIVFREDVVSSTYSGSNPVNVCFSGRDRANLVVTGTINVAMTLTGLDDGDVKFILLTKTANKTVTFLNANDLTPIQDYITAASKVLYRITSKNGTYYAEALKQTIRQATDSILGIQRNATTAEVRTAAAVAASITSKTLSNNTPFVAAVLGIDWSGDVEYRRNNIGQLEIRGSVEKLQLAASPVATLPFGFRPIDYDGYIPSRLNRPYGLKIDAATGELTSVNMVKNSSVEFNAVIPLT